MSAPLQGLTAAEVSKNRQLHGENKLPLKQKTTKWRMLLSQFISPLVFILLIAAVITLALKEMVDFFAIIAIIIVNSFLGFFQENRAQNALNALKKMVTPKVTVIRDREEQLISTEELVVGDLVKLKLGDRVPADGIILTESNLTLNEAALTGESGPVEKFDFEGDEGKLPSDTEKVDNRHRVFMGTIVLTGFGVYKVTHVGTGTEFGRIAQTLSGKDELKTPLQQRLDKFSKQIAVIVLVMATFVFISGFFLIDDTSELTHGLGDATKENTTTRVINLLILSVSLAVSAIPEGLAISVTVILTISMQRLLKRKALVRKLVVAETLGSVTTICVDKTGTLTEGKMSVIAADLVDETVARKAMIAANKNLNAVDAALINWLEGSGEVGKDDFKIDVAETFADDPGIKDIPFNSKSKFAMSIHQKNTYIVGAPDILLRNSALSSEEKNEWEHKMNVEAQKGHRLIGVAHKANNPELDMLEGEFVAENMLEESTWLGFVIIEDPIRTDVKSAFEAITNAGIKLKVITGDQKATATYVMHKAGIPIQESEMMSGTELQALDEDDLLKKIDSVKLFYRTAPDQKLRIVKALQGQDEVVGMMGDGINDAPALKRADVGIAVENATEVSKETADIVLLDNNMHTIVAAVEEGRSIFENMKKVITYLLSDATAEVLLIIGSIVLGLPIPLIPLQILFINLVADGFPDIALGFEPAEKTLLSDSPRPRKAQLVDKEMLSMIFIIGVVVNIFIFLIYAFFIETGVEIGYIRSFIFMLLAVDSLLYVFSIRSLRTNIWQRPIFGNMTLNVAVLLGLASVFFAFYFPPLRDVMRLEVLAVQEIIFIFSIALLKIILIEGVKALFNRHILKN